MSTQEKVAIWLVKAPLPTLVVITITTLAGIAGWVWAVSNEVSDDKAAVAAAVVQSKAAADSEADVQRRLLRFEIKLDKIGDSIAEIREHERERDRRDRDKENTR